MREDTKIESTTNKQVDGILLSIYETVSEGEHLWGSWVAWGDVRFEKF